MVFLSAFVSVVLFGMVLFVYSGCFCSGLVFMWSSLVVSSAFGHTHCLEVINLHGYFELLVDLAKHWVLPGCCEDSTKCYEQSTGCYQQSTGCYEHKISCCEDIFLLGLLQMFVCFGHQSFRNRYEK